MILFERLLKDTNIGHTPDPAYWSVTRGAEFLPSGSQGFLRINLTIQVCPASGSYVRVQLWQLTSRQPNKPICVLESCEFLVPGRGIGIT